MKKRAHVTIVVPCYNQAQYLDECLQSVIGQTFSDWECIIVNDGSPDNVNEVAQKWIDKDHRFKIINKENGGLSSARNAGIKAALGEYILPLDADDYISQNYVERCLNVLLTNPDCKVAYGKGYKFGEINAPWELPSYSYNNLLKQNMIFCTALYRKNDWIIAGGYDTKMKGGLEDWEFWINILKHGGSCIQTHDCAFYYRVKEGSMVKQLQSKKDKIHELTNYIFLKHIDAFGAKHPIEFYDKYKTSQHIIQFPYTYYNAFELIGFLIRRITYRLKKSIKNTSR